MEEYKPIEVEFANIKTVQGRSVMQLILEIPIEYSDEVLRELGGVPQPAKPKRCALVRIND